MTIFILNCSFFLKENVEDWLNELGLDQYWEAFRENSYTEPRDLADIKYLPADSISAIFGIVKEAHLKKLKMATSVLSYPTKGFHFFFTFSLETSLGHDVVKPILEMTRVKSFR